MNMSHLLIGYLFSMFLGALITWIIIDKLAWPYIKRHHKIDFVKSHSLTIWIGILERFLFTTAVLMGSSAFIPVWIAIKVAPQWDRWKGSERVTYNVFLLGNMISIIFSLSGAWIAWGLPNNPLW